MFAAALSGGVSRGRWWSLEGRLVGGESWVMVRMISRRPGMALAACLKAGACAPTMGGYSFASLPP